MLKGESKTAAFPYLRGYPKMADVHALIPKMSEKVNAVTLLKAGQRYKQIIRDHGLPKGKPEIKRIGCWEILPSPFNRLGRFLNVTYIQVEMVPQICDNAFNPDRPNPGVVVKRVKPDRLARLHSHARNMISTQGNLLPPIEVGPAQNKECLGGNHLTMTIRCFRSNFYCTLSRRTAEIAHDDDLLLVSTDGHFLR